MSFIEWGSRASQPLGAKTVLLGYFPIISLSSFSLFFFFGLACFFFPQQILNSSPVLPLSQSGLCAEQNSVCLFVHVCVYVCVMKRERERERERGGKVCCQRGMVRSLCARLHKPSFLDGHTNAPTHSQTRDKDSYIFCEEEGGGSFLYIFLSSSKARSCSIVSCP